MIYFVIIVPYKTVQARRGITALGDPAPAKTRPACLSDDLPVAASKCKYRANQPPSVAKRRTFATERLPFLEVPSPSPKQCLSARTAHAKALFLESRH